MIHATGGFAVSDVAFDPYAEILRRLDKADEKRDENQRFVMLGIGELKERTAAIETRVGALEARAAATENRVTKVEGTDKVGRAIGTLAMVLAAFAGADNQSVRMWLSGLMGR